MAKPWARRLRLAGYLADSLGGIARASSLLTENAPQYEYKAHISAMRSTGVNSPSLSWNDAEAVP
ncbi:hypothetical protein ACPV5O_20765 [Vibrio maritimus]|uniref:hypothetical protein n=1 Tax=Vibrio maritimus TaxID=990268 RepID=UPI004067C194